VKLTREYSSVQANGRRIQASNYTEFKDWARDFLQFLQQSRQIHQRLENSTRRLITDLKPEKDKDKDK